MASGKNQVTYTVLLKYISEGGVQVRKNIEKVAEAANSIGKVELGDSLKGASQELLQLQRDIATHAAPPQELEKRWKKLWKEITNSSKTFGLYSKDKLKEDEANLKKYKEELDKVKDEDRNKKRKPTLSSLARNGISDSNRYRSTLDGKMYFDEKTAMKVATSSGKMYENKYSIQGKIKNTGSDLFSAEDFKSFDAFKKKTENLYSNINSYDEGKDKESIAIAYKYIEALNMQQKAFEEREQVRVDSLPTQEELAKLTQEYNIHKQEAEILDQLNDEVINSMRVENGLPLANVSEEAKTEGQTNISQELSTKNAEDMANKVVNLTAIFMTLKKVMTEVYQVTKELDTAFNEIAIVSNYTTKEVWNMYDSFLNIANITGTTSTEIIKVAGEYFRQGKSYTETLKLTEAAAMSARVAGISATESVKYLTSALNGYNLSANEALDVSDKFAALSASAATDYESLAIALSKVAAQANSAGVSMDNLLGFMTKALETTQEAPENIGTAFKTIFARMAEIKDYGKVLEDNTSANQVSKALDSIGVKLFDTTGNMRNLDEVLIEVGYKWEDLNSVQQKYLATALAGTRLKTRLACSWAA